MLPVLSVRTMKLCAMSFTIALVSLNQGRYTWRHDSILRHIVQLLQAPSTKNDINHMTSSGGAIPADILPTSQLRDLFLYNEKAKKAVIAELTVPFEPNNTKSA